MDNSPISSPGDVEEARRIIEAWCHEDKCLELTTEHDQENRGAICMRQRIASALARKGAAAVRPFVEAGLADPATGEPTEYIKSVVARHEASLRGLRTIADGLEKLLANSPNHEARTQEKQG